IRILRDYGHQTWAAFTLGYDGDTEDSIKQTLDFALENKFTFAAFNILMPYPGTDFYRRMEREGRLLYDGKWWLHPEYRFNHAAFIPSKLTPDRLSGVCFGNRKSFNSLRSILRRAFDLKTNMRNPVRLGTYLAYNPLFRRETFKKQGMRLGLEK
ncbi:MAG: methylase, partial [Proteobacteria bacterium]|nr:methylase [Pseudomonadota bacterium]